MLPIYVLLLMILITMAASFALAAYALQNRRQPGVKAFAGLMGLTFLWSVFAVFILISPDPEFKELLTRARMICVAFSTPLIVLIHTHMNPRADLHGRPRLQALLFVMPLLSTTVLLAPGLREYGLYDFRMIETWGLSSVTFVRGPVMRAQQVYGYLGLVYAISLAARMWWRGDATRRRQAVWMSLGTIVPFTGHWVGMFGGWPLQWYQVSAGLLGVTAVCLSVALFRYRMLDWEHLAKSQVFERLPDPVMKLDDQNRLRVFNSAARRMFAVSPRDLGRGWSELDGLPPVLVAGVAEGMRRMRAELSPRHVVEIVHEGPAGAPPRSWAVHLDCARSWNPRDAGLLISFHDISERKALESKIRDHTVDLTTANSRLEELVGFKNRLLSLVAHDLSGNIGTMVMVSSALQSKVEAQVDEPARKMLRLMVRSSVSVQEFFSNLIHWIAKLDSRLEPHLKICDLQGLIERSVEQLTPILLVQRQKVVVNAANPVLIAADPDMITAVIRNLLSNAIAASRPGQEIVVGIEDGPREVLLWVQDRGVGIAPARLAQLLSGQNVLPKDQDSPSPGFGIGLSICRDFVAYHGGRLHAESVPGEGSRFSFTLPKSPVRELKEES